MEVIGSGKRRDLIAMISLEVGWLLNSSRRRPYKQQQAQGVPLKHHQEIHYQVYDELEC